MVFKIGYLYKIEIELGRDRSKWEASFLVENEDGQELILYTYYPKTEQEKKALYEIKGLNNKFVLDISKNLKGEERIFNIYQNIVVEK